MVLTNEGRSATNVRLAIGDDATESSLPNDSVTTLVWS
jgi:O-glycosyl hydrolase